MVSLVNTITFSGIEVIDVSVEVQLSPGIPSFSIVGLADKTISEAKDRVRSALNSIGLALPAKKITVNLAPADLHKEGSHFDLPIMIALLASLEIIKQQNILSYIALGELSLDGSVRSVAGILPAAIGANARDKGIICSINDASEAAWSGNNNILGIDNIIELINHFNEKEIINTKIKPANKPLTQNIHTDFKYIKGQETGKRAAEIAAAGEHNMLMSGPPGTGKSMIASAIPSILPEMNFDEMLESSMVYSIAGLIKNGALQSQRPFRAPHHSCSPTAMVGGGMAKRISPGEISLAHKGILFLDELPEFPRAVLENLRQPMETGQVMISRIAAHVAFPASFQLIAAMNPCKCGYLDDVNRNCNKAPKCALEYQNKISGPLMDRIDIQLEIPNILPYEINFSSNNEESSEEITKRVLKARTIQKERYKKHKECTNGKIPTNIFNQLIKITPKAKNIIDESANKYKFSIRSYNKILKLSQTIADLDGSLEIHHIHALEAMAYRDINCKIKQRA